MKVGAPEPFPRACPRSLGIAPALQQPFWAVVAPPVATHTSGSQRKCLLAAISADPRSRGAVVLGSREQSNS